MVFQLQLCLANYGRDNILHSMVGWCRQPAHLNCTVLGRTTLSVTRDVVSLCVVSHLQSASVVRFGNLLILTNSNASVSSISYAASWEDLCLPKFPASGSSWSTPISSLYSCTATFFPCSSGKDCLHDHNSCQDVLCDWCSCKTCIDEYTSYSLAEHSDCFLAWMLP